MKRDKTCKNRDKIANDCTQKNIIFFFVLRSNIGTIYSQFFGCIYKPFLLKYKVDINGIQGASIDRIDADIKEVHKLEKTFREMAEELVSKMTVDEVATQLKYDSPAIPRLGIPAYNWWNEVLHGVARAGTATVFPQAIAMAAMFDDGFLKEIAETIATEARAKYNAQAADEDRDIYKGLTVWSPNVNIFRDPRWGRGHETYGEDPYLTSRLGVAFIKGLQGDGKYLKTAACAKHFAVHSGPEAIRHSFDAIASKKDMYETYLPAFKAAVQEADVETVMGAYNRTNGEPCCGSKTLLVDILKEEWGFDGHIVSDCWAIRDFHTNHMVTSTAAESAALALKNGCDLNCGNTYLHLMVALQEGLITEEDLRTAAVRLFTTRYKLGLFADDCEFDAIGYDQNDTVENRAMSQDAARKSMVMLKNDGILPLDKSSLKTIGVIGPTADSKVVLEGNYNGTASEYITNLEGIREAVGPDVRIYYSEGCHLYKNRVQELALPNDRISEAKTVARHSDVVVLCLGLDSTIEGEEGDTGNSFAAGDKNSLFLPESQQELLKAVVEIGKPTIVVINSGSALDVSYADETCNAIIQSWYSGGAGGRALADLLFGKCSPSGKLPVTFYYDRNLPDFEDYSMKNRTYRYMEDEALYPFGFGLSYTTFTYDGFTVADDGDGVTCEVTVSNTGAYDADEVVQVYVANNIKEKVANGKNTSYESLIDADNQPKYSLCGFARVSLAAGESKKVSVKIAPLAFETVLEDGSRVTLAGDYTLYIGGQQPDARSAALMKRTCLSQSIQRA